MPPWHLLPSPTPTTHFLSSLAALVIITTPHLTAPHTSVCLSVPSLLESVRQSSVSYHLPSPVSRLSSAFSAVMSSRDMKSSCLFGSKHFLAITGDNRLRLWDIVNNKEKRCFVEKQHLSHSYTCFAWGQDVATKGASDLGMCAVGTSDGVIIIWDLTRGIVAKTIGTPGSGPAPTDIQFSYDLKTIFACSSDNNIYEYSVNTGETKQVIKGFKKGALRLAVNQKVLAAASGYIRLHDLVSGKKEKLDASFSSGGVSVMAFSNCGHYLACAGGAREVVLFDLRDCFSGEGGEGEGKKLGPLCVCPVSGTPLQLAVRVVPAVGKKGGARGRDLVDVLCVLQGGQEGGCLLRVEEAAAMGTGKAKSAEPVITVVPFSGIDSAAATHDEVLSGCFASSSTGKIVLAMGQVSTPRFVTLPYMEASTSSLLRAVTLPPSSHTLSVGSDKVDGVDAGLISNGVDVVGEVSILGPHENGGSKRPRIGDEDEGSAGKRLKGGDAGALDKLTVEERLNSAAAALIKLDTLAEGSTGKSTVGDREAPTTDSLVVLVEQALQAGDDGLLEQCLECSEQDVVAETSKRLPTQLVVPLLRKLVAKFEKKPTRGVLLTRWIHGLLRCHMSFLLSVPDLSQQLAALSQMLEQRLATYSRLASLAGRLDLLISQISSSTSSASSSASASNRHEAVKSPNQIYYED